jgi:ABC-type multidrug transport system ATPase subunit
VVFHKRSFSARFVGFYFLALKADGRKMGSISFIMGLICCGVRHVCEVCRFSHLLFFDLGLTPWWICLAVSLWKTGAQLELLKGVSGFAKPGQITALLGSSGAGKTTLKDVIAGRKTGGEIRDSIVVNGQPQHMKTFSRISGYVEQTDIHSPMTTVREAVQFSARLHLSESVSLTIKNAFAEEIMSTLELSPMANQIVGTLNDGGLSVEQRKRLTIAVELGVNPSLLFLNESTSGLDARAAIIVLQSVREIAYTGRSAMCTIHQPSTFLLQMFDQLFLLKRGGETVFFGELGHKCRTVFSSLL